MISNIIELDQNGQPMIPEIILANRRGTKIGHIYNAINVIMPFHMASANEISFDVYKEHDGVINEVWDEIKDFRFVFLPYYQQWYEISVPINEADGIVKHVSGMSVYEAELSQLTLNEIEINTADDLDAIAALYPNEVKDNKEYQTQFFNPADPNRSLLHRLLSDKAAHYSIFHVDTSLMKEVRQFTFDDTPILDALQQIQEELECLFVFGEHEGEDEKLHRTISVYDLKDVCKDCGYRGVENGTCPSCGSHNYIKGYGFDTKIFVSRENLSSEIQYETNVDQVKNCFRLVAGDDYMTYTIRNLNPSGDQYIWYFSDDMLSDMSVGLRKAITDFYNSVEEYNNNHVFEIPEETINKYNDLVDKYNAIRDNKFVKLTYPITGYSKLTDAYYNASDLSSYLTTSLLPVADAAKDTTAEEQIKLLTEDDMSPLGLKDEDSISKYLADSLVKERAKVLVDTSRYRVTVTNRVFNDMIWLGTITLESYSDKEDVATTDELRIEFNNDYHTYLRQQLDIAMTKYDENKIGITELFKKSDDDFKEDLHMYGQSGLSNLHSVGQACLEVMMNEHIGEKDNINYDNFYKPYYDKVGFIEAELKLRTEEVNVITNDDDTGLVDLIEREREASAEALNIKAALTADQWAELSSFRRDQLYSNSNYVSDGLSSSELIENARKYLDDANKELRKAATLQHSISGTLYNFLLLVDDDGGRAEPEQFILGTMDDEPIITNMDEYIKIHDPLFAPLVKDFELGNWIHLQVDEKVYKLRLTDYDLDFNEIENLNVTFSDVVESGGFLNDTASILKSAMAISTSYDYVSRQASSGEAANQKWISMDTNGMNLDQRRIVNNTDESLLIDSHGMLMRKMNDYGTDYDPEQVRILNKGLYYTNDAWETVGTGIGAFTYTDPETGEVINDYGVIAKTIIGRLILGESLGIYTQNGNMKMNEDGLVITSKSDGNKDIFTVRKDNGDGTYDNYIYVNDNGNVIIDGSTVRIGHDDEEKTIEEYIDDNLIPGESGMDGLNGESPITVTIDSTAGNIFKNKQIASILTCTVKRGNEDITSEVTAFKWIRKDKDGNVDESWTRTLAGNSIPISADDVYGKAVFECEVTLPEEDDGIDDQDIDPIDDPDDN